MVVKIDILCVGKIKESYFTDAIGEYSKRLRSYCNINIIEVKDEKTPEHASAKEEEIIKKVEAERLLKHISDKAALVALCIEGKEMDSVSFSSFVSACEIEGRSHIQFIIGGSLGIDEELKKRASKKLSFSKMTFPHQLMRVVLLEQLYRAYRIKNNEPYHK